MSEFVDAVAKGFEQAFLMAYQVWWALVLGFAISGIVQAWLPRERIERRSPAVAPDRSRKPPASSDAPHCGPLQKKKGPPVLAPAISGLHRLAHELAFHRAPSGFIVDRARVTRC